MTLVFKLKSVAIKKYQINNYSISSIKKIKINVKNFGNNKSCGCGK